MSLSNSESTTQVPTLSRGRIAQIAVVLLIAAAVVAVFVWRGVNTRIETAASDKQETQQLAVPAVAVVHPKLGATTNQITLSGALLAFSDSPIYARASGYIKKWSANLGDAVTAGQVLAEIDAPEMDAQLSQAQATLQQTRASLQQAQANLVQSQTNEAVAKLGADRWRQLVKDGIVAQQDTDTKVGAYQALVANSNALRENINAVRSTIAAQEANIATLMQLMSYRSVRAPFDGVITARNTDVGALVNGTNTAATPELFHIADIHKLRLYVSVPEVYANAAVQGLTAKITLEEFPNRTFTARLVRNGGAIDPTTRTLLTEFEIDNASHELRPGAYAEVALTLPSPGRALLVPGSAIIYRPEGTMVGLVNADNTAKVAHVALGKDFGDVVEVTSGIAENDSVIESPPDSISTGMAVRVVPKNTGK